MSESRSKSLSSQSTALSPISPRVSPFQPKDVDFDNASVIVSPKDELGSGTSGHVYLGQYKKNTNTESYTVAVKYCDDNDDTEYTVMSALQAKQQSPYLIKLIDYKHSDNDVVLVLEYMQRGGLNKTIEKNSQCDWDTRLQILENSISGLSFMHNAGYLHRDLKSANILLDMGFHAKLCDFGCSFKEAKEGDGQRVGSPPYMAPETLSWTSPTHSKKSDIYAFGMILLEVAAWNEEKFDKVIFQDISSRVDFYKIKWPLRLQTLSQFANENCPTDISKLIQYCMQMNPDNRPATDDVKKCLTRMNKIHGEVRQVFFARVSVAKSEKCEQVSDNIAGLVREYAAEDMNPESLNKNCLVM